jgi:hypothetical protein
MPTAGTTHDIVLDGYGYMLALGGKGASSSSYSRKAGPSRLGMVSVNVQNAEALSSTLPAFQIAPFLRLFWDNWQGVGQKLAPGVFAAANKAGLVADLVALQPVLNGQALALAPQGVQGIALAATASTGAAHHTLQLGNLLIVTVDAQIFASANPGTGSTGLTKQATAAAAVTGMVAWAGTVLFSAGGTLYTLNTGTWAIVAFGTALAGAELLTVYQGCLFANIGSTLYWIIPAVGTWATGPTLESAITAFEELEGSLYVGTKTALYRDTAQLKVGAPATAPGVFNVLDYKLDVLWRSQSYQPLTFWTEFNFVKMVGWRGYLWFFAGNQLMRARPATTAGHLEIEPQTVQGASLGLAVCGRYLVVITRNIYNSTVSTVWVNDGVGWWKLDQNTSWAFPFGNPFYPQGAINAFVLSSTTNYSFTRWLLDTTSPVGFKSDNYAVTRTTVSGKVTLPLLSPEDLSSATGGKVQAFKPLRVGLEWVTIDGLVWWPTINTGALTASKMRVEISLDAGATWTLLVDPATGFDYYQPASLEFKSSRMELPIDSAQANSLYPASPNGNGLIPDPSYLIRVTWEGTNMPLLRRVWLDVKPVDIEPDSGRVWDLDLSLSEPFIGLDGAGDTDTGLIKINRLWALWTNSTSVVFTDIDGAGYRVKVAGMEAKRAAAGVMPGLAPGWAVNVKLAEVFE